MKQENVINDNMLTYHVTTAFLATHINFCCLRNSNNTCRNTNSSLSLSLSLLSLFPYLFSDEHKYFLFETYSRKQEIDFTAPRSSRDFPSLEFPSFCAQHCTKMSIAGQLLLLLLAAGTSHAAKYTFRETTKFPKATKNCDETTSHEATHVYTAGSLVEFACCTVAGLKEFHEDATAFTLKSTNKPANAMCCMAPGSECQPKIKCCNNYECKKNDGRNYQFGLGTILCTKGSSTPKDTSVTMELMSDSCKDKKKHYHVKITVKEKAKTFTGHACCDTDKIHTVNVSEHCCSTSNAPYLRDKPNLTPPCCAKSQFESDVQFSNGQKYSATVSKGKTRFCGDNQSGDYKVTKDLSRKAKLFGSPKAGEDNKVDCCKGTSKVAFLNNVCCDSVTDRFQDAKGQKRACCTTGELCHQGIRCCSGKCVVVETGEDGKETYGCKKKGKAIEFKTGECGDEGDDGEDDEKPTKKKKKPEEDPEDDE